MVTGGVKIQAVKMRASMPYSNPELELIMVPPVPEVAIWVMLDRSPRVERKLH
jgi:hypothetical protein